MYWLTSPLFGVWPGRKERTLRISGGIFIVSARKGLDHLPLISMDCSPQGAETRWASSAGPEGEEEGWSTTGTLPGAPCITYLLSIFFILLWCSFWPLCVFVNHFKSFSWKVPMENDLLRFLQGKLDLFTVLLPLLPRRWSHSPSINSLKLTKHDGCKFSKCQRIILK